MSTDAIHHSDQLNIFLQSKDVDRIVQHIVDRATALHRSAITKESTEEVKQSIKRSFERLYTDGRASIMIRYGGIPLYKVEMILVNSIIRATVWTTSTLGDEPYYAPPMR